MLVICPKCFTQYVVSDEIKLPEGQKFHCSACQNYFLLDAGRQNAFLSGNEDETDIIPTVSAVMNQQNGNVITNSVVPSGVEKEIISSKQQVVAQNNTVDMQTSDISLIQSPAEPKFTEPLSLLSQEVPQTTDRLDSIPEAFKPVIPEKKKTSVLSVLFWLCVAGGICYGAYLQKDFLIAQVDEFVLGSLDKDSQKQSVKTLKKETAKNIQKAQSEDIKQKQVERVDSVKRIEKTDDAIQKTEKVQSMDVVSSVMPIVKPQNQMIKENDGDVKQPDIKNADVSEDMVQSVDSYPKDTTKNVLKNNPDSQNATAQIQLTDVPLNNNVALPVNSVDETTKEEEILPTLNSKDESLDVKSDDVVPVVIREQAVVSDAFAGLGAVPEASVSEASRILTIRDIVYELSPNEAGVMRLMIKGNIANTELKKMVIPELKAVVYNHEDMVVARKRIILSQPEVEGNTVQSFFSSVVPAPAEVARVEVIFDE
ncbi:MAG: zinc-ribbon domain-containing protein [Alphaproteobacteria bacterium]|nr:zinc-ribbon domain-containing protein [Alphaproteobacteria bacterium]